MEDKEEPWAVALAQQACAELTEQTQDNFDCVVCDKCGKAHRASECQEEKICVACAEYQFEPNAQHWCDYKDRCTHSPETQGSFFVPKLKSWYEDIPESGIWCKCWDGEYDKAFSIEKIIQYCENGTFFGYSRYWQHAEPVSDGLSKLLDAEVD